MRCCRATCDPIANGYPKPGMRRSQPPIIALTIIDDETPPPVGDELYTYDLIGNLTSKTGVGAYTYSAAHPHAVTNAGGIGFGYDANGNMTSAGGQIATWDQDT